MRAPSRCGIPSVLLIAAMLIPVQLLGVIPPKKPRTVQLGTVRQVPYSKAGDPAGAGPEETILKTRALLVDGRVSEWTTGEAHDVTDRSFVVRRALRINDTLPADSLPAGTIPANSPPSDFPVKTAKPATEHSSEHWVWQRGPWLLVDRVTGRVTALKLPDYDPGASQVAWFRDYGAYCGVTATGKSLYAVVAQVGVRKPVLAKKLAAYDPSNHPWPVCTSSEWQRDPLKITFHPAGREAASFDLAAGSATLVEDGDPAEPAKP